MKPKSSTILRYLFVKYAVSFLIIAILNGEFRQLGSYPYYKVMGRRRLLLSLFYHGLDILIVVLFFMAVFTIPFYLAFRIKNPLFFWPALLAVFMAEYFVYDFFTTYTAVNINGIYNGLIGAVFLFVFFFGYIRKMNE